MKLNDQEKDFLFSRIKYPWVKEAIWHLLIPLSLFIIVLLFFPSRSRFQFSSDEGLELAKTWLVEQGYTLYDEIWNDQPPLLTYSVVPAIKLFGNRVGAARLVVMIYSSVLLWAAAQYLRMMWGIKYAIAGVILILLLPRYLQLSVSVMRAIPNLTFALLSLLALTKWHKSQKYHWLILSSMLLGASILTKLFTAVLAPVFVTGILIGAYAQAEDKKKFWRYLSPPFLWGIILVVILVLSGVFLIGLDNLEQLFGDHLTASNFFSESDKLTSVLSSSYPFLFLGFVGFIYLVMKREWLGLYLATWAVVYMIVFSIYTPVRYHYILLITVPAAMLGSIPAIFAVNFLSTVAQYVKKLSPKIANFHYTILALIALILVFFRLPEGFIVLEAVPSLSSTGLGLDEYDAHFLGLMTQYAPQTNWVVTDKPMYAFRAGLSVPPELAVLSKKRIQTGYLTQEEIIEIIQQYQPEQILLERFDFPNVEAAMQTDYEILYAHEGVRLYIRADISQNN
jgi:4-amino-4-deoxy-L-arabinose transferase-like glycosyltransferase